MVAAAHEPGGPERVETLSELAAALDKLRGGLSNAELVKRSGRRTRVTTGVQEPVLRRSTLSDMLSGKSTPRLETLIAFLAVCDVDPSRRGAWLAALERVVHSRLYQPPGSVRVRDARPLLLGVHPSIQVEGRPETADLPPYVSRDFDGVLCAAVTDAARRGGFVLIIGDSSVGKTRALFEAVRSSVPEWWLLCPDPAVGVGPQEAEQLRRTVIWLDELRDHLAGSALTTARVRGLINAGLVLVATLWSDEYVSLIEARVPGRPDPAADARRLLDMAACVHVPATFTATERYRAELLAADRRIRVALDSADAGFTQVLAAAPHLMRRWVNARDPYAKALITTAVDLCRIGVSPPLSRELLAAAAPAYLSPSQRATATPDWFDVAEAYATTTLHGATSVLRPTGPIGTVTGYVVADYLLQQAGRERRSMAVPEAVWKEIIAHCRLGDAQRLGDSARASGQPGPAEALYRRAGEAGDVYSEMRLGELLIAQDRIGELRERADAGGRGAGLELVRLLARQGDLAELRMRSDAGDPGAARTLVAQLHDRGELAEALAVLRGWAETGDRQAIRYMEKVLAEQDSLDELRARAEGGDLNAADRLADLLVKYGQHAELRARADGGDDAAGRALAQMLAVRGEFEELRARADNGDRHAVYKLAAVSAERGDVHAALGTLRGLVDTGDDRAAYQYAELLTDLGDIENAVGVLRAATADGTTGSWYELANLLAEYGDLDEAVAIVLAQPAAGGALINPAPVSAALADEGRVEDLQTLAEAGSHPAQNRLVELLADQGRIDELRTLADTGMSAAQFRLSGLLARHGQVDELRIRARAGDDAAARRLNRPSTKFDHDFDAGDAANSIEMFLPSWRAAGKDEKSPQALAYLAIVFRDARRFTEAVEAGQQAVAAFQAVGDRRGEGDALGVLGTCLAEAGLIDEATAALQRAVGLFADIVDADGQAGTLLNLCRVLGMAQRHEEAADAARQAAAAYAQNEASNGRGRALSALGGALANAGRFEDAVAPYLEAVEALRATGDEAHVGVTLNLLGFSLIHLDRFAEAVPCCTEAAELLERAGDQRRATEAWINAGYSLQSLGGYSELADVLDRLGRTDDAAELRTRLSEPD